MKKFIILLYLTISISQNTTEVISYNAQFNNIGAGTATLTTKDNSNQQKEIQFNLKTNKVIDIFYKLREDILMLVNSNDYSLAYLKKYSKQGRYSKEHEAQFDYIKNKVYFNNKSKKIKNKVYSPIGIISFLRNRKLSINDQFIFDIYSSGKINPIGMKVIKEETITIQRKKYKCFVIAPIDINDTNKDDKKGKIKIWISKKERIPIIIEQRAKFGNIKLKLNNIKYEN